MVRVATATKLAAVPSNVALRNNIPTATAHPHMVMPVGTTAVGRRQAREINHPTAAPARNGQAVSITPPMLNPSA
jgi:hypothetical protein